MKAGKEYYSVNSDTIVKCIAIGVNGYAFVDGVGGKGFIRGNSWVIVPSAFHLWKEYKEPQKGVFWVNVYSAGSRSGAVGHLTRQEADNAANGNRIACVEVPWVEGQGL